MMPTHSFPSHDLQAPLAAAPGDAIDVPMVRMLDQPVEWMRYCYQCEGDRQFVADRICEVGLVGKCSACQDERVARFTRTTVAA